MSHWTYLLLGIATQGAACPNAGAPPPGAAELIDLLDSIIGLFSGILCLVALIIGVRFINELYLRGFDAICGFHAKLSAHLKRLKRAAWSGLEEPITEENAKQSVFMHFIKEEDQTRTSPFFPDGDLDAFMVCVNDVIQLFERSTGQVPLSKKMFGEMNLLHLTLLDIVTAHKQGVPLVYDPTLGVLNSMTDVKNKAELFNGNIECILAEVDVRIPKMLNRLWRKLKTKKRISS